MIDYVQIFMHIVMLMLIILLFIRANKELGIRKTVIPIKCKILKLYDKMKKETKDYDEARYVDILYDGKEVRKLKLCEFLSKGQEEIYVHNKDKVYLHFRECKKEYSDEFNIAMFHDFSRINILTILAILIIVYNFSIDIYNSKNPYTKQAIEEVNQRQSEIDELNDKVFKDYEDTSEGKRLLISYVVMNMHNMGEVETINDCQTKSMCLEASYALLTGEQTDKDLYKTNFLLRDYLFEKVNDCWCRLALVLREMSLNNVNLENEINTIKDEFYNNVYMLTVCLMFRFVFLILSLIHIGYKVLMNIILFKMVKTFRKENNIL